MKLVRQKNIALLLIMLMLMTPLTGMAMQWSVDSHHPADCDDMAMTEFIEELPAQPMCNMDMDCQELCASNQHCSSSAVSLISNSASTSFTEPAVILFSNIESFQFALVLNELYRPPRA